MKTVADLLEAAKRAQSLPSDAALARAVGVTRGSISNWRNGVSLPDAVACAALAGLTGEPLARVLGIVGEARAISREEKAVWRKLAATATLLLIAVVPYLNSAAAYASVGHEQQSERCIMRSTGCAKARAHADVDPDQPPAPAGP